MPAPISAARLQANRRNAQLSSGPKTPEGKARSRANAVKHGLTGAGIALPSEDAAAIEARFLTMQEDFAPSTLGGALLIHLAALMSVRIERCGRLEAAAVAHLRRHAGDEFELARLDDIDDLFHTITADPRGNHRRLQTSIEGVDLLLAALQGVRDQVESGAYQTWTDEDRAQVDAFLGGASSKFLRSRAAALMQALQGNLDGITSRERTQLPPGDTRQSHLRVELILLVDVERARLEQVRATIDPSIVADDRQEAAGRATLPMTPESILHKKYEAAAISTFLRAIRDFQKVEKAEAEAVAEVTQPDVQPTVVAPAAAPVPAVSPPVAAVPNMQPVVKNEPIAPRAVDPNPNPNNVPVHHFSGSR